MSMIWRISSSRPTTGPSCRRAPARHVDREALQGLLLAHLRGGIAALASPAPRRANWEAVARPSAPPASRA